MRPFLLVLTGALILALGLATSVVQSRNHELAARLDARQGKFERTRMFILSAEATVLAAEILPVTPESVAAPTVEVVQ